MSTCVGRTRRRPARSCKPRVVVDTGPFTRRQLAERGVDPARVRELLDAGRLQRVARLWLADVHTSAEAIRAVQLGGRLGCLSACRHHGLWVPHDTDLHVALNPGAPVDPSAPEGVRFHRLSRRCPTAVLPLEDAVSQVVHRHDGETALVVLESAVNRRLMHEADARALLHELPVKKARVAPYFSPLAESGSETRLRLFFQRHRVPVRPQAYIPGVGRVDLLVGRSWIIEADGEAYHSAPQDVLVDRRRDLHSRLEGYDCDRLSSDQIWNTWSSTRQYLLTKVRTRRHLRPPVPMRRG